MPHHKKHWYKSQALCDKNPEFCLRHGPHVITMKDSRLRGLGTTSSPFQPSKGSLHNSNGEKVKHDFYWKSLITLYQFINH